MEATQEAAWELKDEGCYVALTNDLLNIQEVMDRVRSPAAGAIVVFAGMFNNSLALLMRVANPICRNNTR